MPFITAILAYDRFQMGDEGRAKMDEIMFKPFAPILFQGVICAVQAGKGGHRVRILPGEHKLASMNETIPARIIVIRPIIIEGFIEDGK